MEDPGGHEQPVGDSPSFFFSNGMKKLPIHWKQCVMKSDYLKKKMGHDYMCYKFLKINRALYLIHPGIFIYRKT